jgi:hypothetical protein
MVWGTSVEPHEERVLGGVPLRLDEPVEQLAVLHGVDSHVARVLIEVDGLILSKQTSESQPVVEKKKKKPSSSLTKSFIGGGGYQARKTLDLVDTVGSGDDGCPHRDRKSSHNQAPHYRAATVHHDLELPHLLRSGTCGGEMN